METNINSILLVDDSVNDITLIKKALTEANFANKIIVAEDGEEALDYLYNRGKFAGRSAELPIFILLDIKMPLMDGVEVLKVIRKEPAFKLIPVVMLTSSRDDHDLKECYENGANSFVVKPVNMSSFMQVVKDIGKYWVVTNEQPS